MNQKIGFVLLLLGMLGCEVTNRRVDFDPYAYMWFVKKENICILDTLRNKQPLLKIKSDLLLLGMNASEIEQEFNDPFVCQVRESLIFESLKYSKELSSVINRHLVSLEWRRGRKGLRIEETNSGGDWIQVYENGEKKIQIHISGRWEGSENPDTHGNFSTRTIIFKFLNCDPSDIFTRTVILNFENDDYNKRQFLKLFGSSTAK